jgi:hypothetical protein
MIRLTTLMTALAAIAIGAVLPLAATGPEEISRLTGEVEALRGLRFLRPVEHRMLARTELRGFLETQIRNELPVSIDTYMATLEALHLVDSSATVDAMLDLYDAQVLAFYDPVGHVYYSLDEPPADVFLPGGMIDAIVVHELTHALQDQRFDAGKKAVEAQSNWDRALTYQAVLEGEALLVMIAHLGKGMGVGLEDDAAREAIVDAVRGAVAAEMDAASEVPAYFVESLKFPYVQGLTFVFEAYMDGGWAAVDSIHRDPPRSTAELLNPEVYRMRVAAAGRNDGQKQKLSRPSERLFETTLGQFHWSFLLGHEAGSGWASDVVSVRHGKDGATVLVDSWWDDAREAEEFETAYREFLDGRNAPNRAVSRTGERVKAAYGADQKAVRVFVGGVK